MMPLLAEMLRDYDVLLAGMVESCRSTFLRVDFS